MSHLVPELAVGGEDTRTRLMKMKLERPMKVVSPPHFVPLNIPLCFRSFVLQKCLMTLVDNAAPAAALMELKFETMEMN